MSLPTNKELMKLERVKEENANSSDGLMNLPESAPDVNLEIKKLHEQNLREGHQELKELLDKRGLQIVPELHMSPLGNQWGYALRPK